jgi:hypothetical protein
MRALYKPDAAAFYARFFEIVKETRLIKLQNEITRFWKKYLSRGNALHFLVGYFLSPIGVPGFVRSGDYEDGDKKVSVRFERLWTIVSINGSDVYFRRLTGTFDGIAGPLSSDKEDSTPQLIHLSAPLDTCPKLRI